MSGNLSDEELYAKLGDQLIRFATTIVGPTDAEDVMTDGVLSAMGSRRWASVDDRAGYMYRCVLNAGRMHLRSQGRRRAREERVGYLDRSTVLGIPNLAPEVLDAVAGLSARQRAVIFLRYWEDLDEQAIARRLDIGVGSVRRHLHRAKNNIEVRLHDSL